MPQATSSSEDYDGEEAYRRHIENSDDLVSSQDGGESVSAATSVETDDTGKFPMKQETIGTDELPLGERIRFSNHSHISKFHSAQYVPNGEAGNASQKQRQRFAREHKHRPVEMSSKKPVSVLRDSTLGLGDGSGIMKKKRTRDPRFDSLSGNYSEKAFKKRFSFIFDEKIPEEQRDIKDSLSKVKSSSKKEILERRLEKLNQQLRAEESRRKHEARKQKVLDSHRNATKGQSNKYHLKKSEIKKQELILKYQELQDSGRLDKYMEKRRKKNAAKDHRYLPFSRDT